MWISTHTHTHTTPSIIIKFIAAYKRWDEDKNHFPKKSRFTFGGKIDTLFLDALELVITASYLQKQQKLPYLQKANIKLEILKFFLQTAWEMKILDSKKYIALSESLNEIGRMLGGWLKGLQKETPPQQRGGE